MIPVLKCTALLQKLAHESAAAITAAEVLDMATIGGARATPALHLRFVQVQVSASRSAWVRWSRGSRPIYSSWIPCISSPVSFGMNEQGAPSCARV
jgi:hypothetical protein